MGTQSINFDNIDDVKYNGSAMDKVYLNSTLLWERSVEVTAAESEAFFNGSVSYRTSGSKYATVNRFGGGSSGGVDRHEAYLHYIALPKPGGFSLKAQNLASKNTL